MRRYRGTEQSIRIFHSSSCSGPPLTWATTRDASSHARRLDVIRGIWGYSGTWACMWASSATMLMKLAMEKTLMDVDVSLRMLIFWWTMW